MTNSKSYQNLVKYNFGNFKVHLCENVKCQYYCHLDFFFPTILWKNGIRLDRIRIRSDVVKLDLDWTSEKLQFRLLKADTKIDKI